MVVWDRCLHQMASVTHLHPAPSYLHQPDKNELGICGEESAYALYVSPKCSRSKLRAMRWQSSSKPDLVRNKRWSKLRTYG